MNELSDLRPGWLKVARRCQSAVGTARGFSVVQVRLLVGPGGDPVMWFQPHVDPIEPLGGASVFLHTVLEKMIE